MGKITFEKKRTIETDGRVEARSSDSWKIMCTSGPDKFSGREKLITVGVRFC